MASKDILTNTQRYLVSNNPLNAMNTEIKLTSPKPQVKYFEGDLNDKERKQVVMKLIRFLKAS
jgi:hypothetical protein